MKLFVTGGAGFIGSNFVHYWLENYPSDSIVVFDKLTYAGNLENLKSIVHKITFIQGDIVDAQVVDRVMQGIDIVVHFAAESHVDRSILSADDFVRTNVLGTQVLLEAARKHKVWRFHHVSTDEVFGQIDLDSKERWTENSSYNPRSPYSASKAGSDHLVRSYYSTYGLPVTISNCSNNFGPYCFPEKLIPLAVTNLLEGKTIPVYKPGNQVRDWLYVIDHCRAIDLIISKGKVGETYLVGGDHPEYTNLQVAEMICKILGKDSSASISFVGDRPGHDVKYAINPSKIMTELGWRPEHSFEEWLVKTIEWYKNNEAWWKPLKGKDMIDTNQGVKKILIFGNGQFSAAIQTHFKNISDYQIVVSQGVDIRDKEAVTHLIKNETPAIVINTAAKTNLDWCEQNKAACFEVNTLGADTVAAACQEMGVYFIHISTGCIQESKTAEQMHKENDPPSPVSFYSWAKYWADEMILDRINRYGLQGLILRPRQPVSAVASGRNALTKLITYSKFIDTPNSVTVLEDFVMVLEELIRRNATGVYNVANPGIMSPYRLALLLQELVKPDLVVQKISKEELNSMTFAKRIDSVLDGSKLVSLGIVLMPIEERLRKLLPEFKKNLESASEVLAKTKQETEEKLALVTHI